MIDQQLYRQLRDQGQNIQLDAPPEPDHSKPMDRRTIVEQVGPVQVNGQWHLQWQTRTITAQERVSRLAEDTLATRSQRDKFLRESDVYVLPDRWAQMTTQQQHSCTAFRQALRDLPSQPGWPYDITWPTPPRGTDA